MFTLVALCIIDRVGRKEMLLTGDVGMAVAMLVSGIFLLFTTSATRGPVMWAMLTELFPAHIRGAADEVAIMSNWGANFIVSLLFPILLTSIDEGPVFLIFAVIGVLAFLFVRTRLPETKGKSLEQLEAELRGGRPKLN